MEIQSLQINNCKRCVLQIQNNMKYIYTLFSSLYIFFNIHAQVPQGLNYQGVARNAAGVELINQAIGLELSILDGSPSGAIVYTETHSKTTDANGLFSLTIGSGTPTLNTFTAINWAVGGSKWLKVSMDATGGTSYQLMGTSQLMSVPYALFAANSGNSNLPSGTNVGDMLYWNGTTWATIPVGTIGQFLQINSAGIPAWSGGTFTTLTTSAVQPQTYFHTATCGGNITNNGITSSGGSTVSQRGVCWSTSPLPTLSDVYTIDGFGNGAFATIMTSLLANTTYYVRAYAINSAGTAYGNQVSFTTLNPTLATISTDPFSAVTGGTANSGGNVSNEGGAEVTVRGICWSTSPGATIANSQSIDAIGGLGSFPSLSYGLNTNTTYYLRAFATNYAGTSYGNEISFTTTPTLSIGNFYQGGLLAYFLQPSDPGYSSSIPHGIIISPNDLATATWGCDGTNIIGASGTAIGDGNQNTLDIIAGCPNLGIAAEICNSLTLNSYSDWYLPCNGEWLAISTNPFLITGSNMNGFYHSSTQAGASAANIFIPPGSIATGGKQFLAFVRAIRMF
jgi:hypothetical protein